VQRETKGQESVPTSYIDSMLNPIYWSKAARKSKKSWMLRRTFLKTFKNLEDLLIKFAPLLSMKYHRVSWKLYEEFGRMPKSIRVLLYGIIRAEAFDLKRVLTLVRDQPEDVNTSGSETESGFDWLLCYSPKRLVMRKDQYYRLHLTGYQGFVIRKFSEDPQKLIWAFPDASELEIMDIGIDIALWLGWEILPSALVEWRKRNSDRLLYWAGPSVSPSEFEG